MLVAILCPERALRAMVRSRGLSKEVAIQQPSGTKARAKGLTCPRDVFQKLVRVSGFAFNITGSVAIIKIKIDVPVASMYVGLKVVEESILMATAKTSCDKTAEVVRSPANHILRDPCCWYFVTKMFAFKLIQQQVQLIFPYLVRSCSVSKFSQVVRSCQHH